MQTRGCKPVCTYTNAQVDWPERAEALVGKLGDDYFNNGEISTLVSIERAFSKLTKTPERMSWGSSTPLEVNAFYGPKSNG
jgi:predicted metalloendopeptidase